MSQYKKHGILLITFLMVVSLFSFYVFRKETIVIPEEKGKETIVYLLHENTLLEYPFETYTTTIEDTIKEMISFMGKSENGFTPLLYENTILENVKQKDNTIIITFSLLDYPLTLERKLLESLIYSCTQFEEINQIQIQLQDEILSMMPKGGLSLQNTTRTFGINVFESNDIYLHEGFMDLIYYIKKMHNKIYYVPKMIHMKKDSYEEKIKLLCDKTSTHDHLIQPLFQKKVTTTKDPIFEDGILNLYLTSSILNKGNKIDTTCEEILKKTFQKDNAIKMLQIHVNEKVYSINLSNS